MQHSFDIHIAEKYGVNAAILLSNIQHWIAKNRANGKHQHDGKTWTYNSIKAFSELFPYMTIKQIRAALDKLVDENVLMKGNYNETHYDRTCWYAFVDEETLCPTRQMEKPKKANQIAREGEPIPDINTDSKPINSDFKESDKRKVSFEDIPKETLYELLTKRMAATEFLAEIADRIDLKFYYESLKGKGSGEEKTVTAWVGWFINTLISDYRRDNICLNKDKPKPIQSTGKNQYDELLK